MSWEYAPRCDLDERHNKPMFATWVRWQCPECESMIVRRIPEELAGAVTRLPQLLAALRDLAGVDEVEDGEHGDGPACFFCGGRVEFHGLDQRVKHEAGCILERARAELKAAGH